MTNQTTKLAVKPRELTGKKVKKLRRENIIPANIFGNKIKSQNIQVDEKEFLAAYKVAGETSIIELSVEGNKDTKSVLVSNLHVHPVSGNVLHIDFHQVDLKEKVTATVPIELIGESPAVKELGGVLFSPISELEVTALPTEIPSKIELDVSTLVEIGDTLTLKDLKIDTNKLEFEMDLEEAMVIIQEQKVAEVEEVVEEEVAEGEEGQEESTEEAPASDEKEPEKEGQKEDQQATGSKDAKKDAKKEK